MDESDNLTIESKQQLSNAIPLINQIKKVGISALRKLGTAQYAMHDFTYINFLERFAYSLESIEILLQHYEKKPNVETSIGLTIRASLLDFITISFLHSHYTDIIPDNPNARQEFNNLLEDFQSDQIRYTITYLELMKKSKEITQDQFELAITNIHKDYNFAFDRLDLKKPASALKSKGFKSVTGMFLRMKEHPSTTHHAMVYDVYIYYSKYEHYGIMTHFMQRHSINEDVERIIWSIDKIVFGMGLCLAYLNNPLYKIDSEVKHLKILASQFKNLVP